MNPARKKPSSLLFSSLLFSSLLFSSLPQRRR
ncbi:Opacity protein opA54, partial [Neisseria gonorrhoeae]